MPEADVIKICAFGRGHDFAFKVVALQAVFNQIFSKNQETVSAVRLTVYGARSIVHEKLKSSLLSLIAHL